MVAIDNYTKWVETTVLKDKTANTITAAIENLIIRRHGIPERLLTDCGLEFANKELKELAERLNIELNTGSPYHHNTTGAVERAIQSLTSKLKKLTDFGRTSIERQLENATYALNISFNRAINTSPYVLKYGKQPNIEIDKKANNLREDKVIQEIRHSGDQVWQTYAQKDIIKGKKLIKGDFEIGERVLIYREPVKGKFTQTWFPGFKIEKQLGPDSFLVTNNSTKLRLNKKHIKKEILKRGGMSEMI